MDEKRIIGIYRNGQFSPNNKGNDIAILDAVAEELRCLGHKVDTYTEDEFIHLTPEGSVLFSMARRTDTLQQMRKWEEQGKTVVNTAGSIESCIRKRMTEQLTAHHIPHPNSIIIHTDEPFPGKDFPYWIKRGDSHAMVKEDVAFAANREQADAILADFRSRDIPTAVANEHLEGDLVKFYGVQDSDFFHWFYPSNCSHSKFGLEEINGTAKGIPFNASQLKEVCNKASHILGVDIYGGDCIVSPSGEVRIIDFNDWPSFSCCREEAGRSIAAHIHRLTIKKQTQ